MIRRDTKQLISAIICTCFKQFYQAHIYDLNNSFFSLKINRPLKYVDSIDMLRQKMKCVIYCPQCTTWVLKIWKYQLQANTFLGIRVLPSRLITWKVELCLFCFIYHSVEISPTMMLSVVLFLPMNCPWWVGVHQGGLALFRHLVQELQNITEQFWKR
jgi:hypothetical protein